jgi:hypothetical protein
MKAVFGLDKTIGRMVKETGFSRHKVETLLQDMGLWEEWKKSSLSRFDRKIIEAEEREAEARELTEEEVELGRRIDVWMYNMAVFVEEALGINGNEGYAITSQQREACDAVSNLVNCKRLVFDGCEISEEQREYAEKIGISIMSGQGPGKDAWLSWFMLWFLFCYSGLGEVLIPCTAPGSDQLKNILWAEVSRWLYRRNDKGEYLAIPIVRELIQVQGDKIFRKEWGGKQNFAFPKTANPKDDPEAQAKTLYGYHADYMAIIIDEASGVLDPVFKPLEGTLTGKCNFILMTFNPVKRTGFAIESHTGANSRKWLTMRWDCEESDIVSKQHIKDMEEKYGRDSNTFRTLVKGLPPLADSDTLIPYDWVQEAVDRPITPTKEDPHIGFLDPGGGGDNSCYSHRHGLKFDKLERFSSPDTSKVIDWACELYDRDKLSVMGIDNIGIGAGVFWGMKRLGYNVICVDARRKARDEEKFDNVRVEIWWNGRKFFESGTVSIPNDQMLKEQLWSPRFERETKKIKIDSKKVMRKNLGHKSPNEADAVLGNLYIRTETYAKVSEYDDYDHDNSMELMRIISSRKPTDNSWLRV